MNSLFTKPSVTPQNRGGGEKWNFFAMKLTRKRALKAVLAAAVLSISSINVSASAEEFTLKGTLWETAENVDPHLLYAVAMAESQKYFPGGYLRPWPWAVNIKGKGHYFESREEAEKFVDDLFSQGYTNMDIGPMQINTKWHGHRVSNPKDLFNLSIAIAVSSDILKEAMDSAPNDTTLGIGRYHNWEDEQRARNYGSKVIKYWEVISKAGGQ